MANPAEQGGLEQKVDSAKSKILTPEEIENKYITGPASYIDGLGGSIVRSGATSYGVGLCLPLMMVNPILGAAYGAVTGAASYVMSNVGWKAVRFPISLSYKLVRHPIKTVKSGIWSLVKVFTGAGLFTGFFSKISQKLNIQEDKGPKGISGFLFQPHNTNKLGATLGKLIGGAGAMATVLPGAYEGISNLLTTTIGPKLSDAYQGASMAAGKTAGLVNTIKDSVVQYYQPAY